MFEETTAMAHMGKHVKKRRRYRHGENELHLQTWRRWAIDKITFIVL